MKRFVLLAVAVNALFLVPAWGEVDRGKYLRISQCVLAGQRRSLVGEKVQLTGKFLEGSQFCYRVRKGGIKTKDYYCFALGKPCVIRLYLKKDHPQADLLRTLKDGDELTVYGVFDYLGTHYNFIIVDAISKKGE